MTHGTDLITAERERQISEEGYHPDHDLGRAHALLDASRCYSAPMVRADSPVPLTWPWQERYWKPSDDVRRNLTKAGALLAACLDALDLEQKIRATIREQS